MLKLTGFIATASLILMASAALAQEPADKALPSQSPISTQAAALAPGAIALKIPVAVVPEQPKPSQPRFELKQPLELHIAHQIGSQALSDSENPRITVLRISF